MAGSRSQKSQYLDNLDYNITINEDGSIRIVETWDIYIHHTNTVFRNAVLVKLFQVIS